MKYQSGLLSLIVQKTNATQVLACLLLVLCSISLTSYAQTPGQIKAISGKGMYSPVSSDSAASLLESLISPLSVGGESGPEVNLNLSFDHGKRMAKLTIKSVENSGDALDISAKCKIYQISRSQSTIFQSTISNMPQQIKNDEMEIKADCKTDDNKTIVIRLNYSKQRFELVMQRGFVAEGDVSYGVILGEKLKITQGAAQTPGTTPAQNSSATPGQDTKPSGN